MNPSKVEPIKIKAYTVKQSNLEFVGKLPIRDVILGPSGSGKTVLLQNMILEYIKTTLNGSTSSALQSM